MENKEPDVNPGTTTVAMAASLASIALAVSLYMSGNKQTGIFVGLWAPTILGIGTYLNSDRALQLAQQSSTPRLDS